MCCASRSCAAAAEQLAAFELAVLGEAAAGVPPPMPPHNPLPRNDDPFGVLHGEGGPLVMPAAAGQPQPQQSLGGFGSPLFATSQQTSQFS